MAAYYISLTDNIFHISLEITKEESAILTVSSFKTCVHRVSVPTVFHWRSICSLNWYLFRKEKKKLKIPTFAPPQFSTLFAKRERAHSWCLSEAVFVWYSVTSQTAGSFYLITGGKPKKEQNEKKQFQISKEQTAGIRHTCFVQVEQILKVAVDHQYSPCRIDFHYFSKLKF